MSVLGTGKIIEALQTPKLQDRLIVTPLLDQDQIGEASIDVRLGSDFIITRKGNLASIDPAKEDLRNHRYQSKHHINLREKFYLHPNELVLASTLEYFRLPKRISGSVTSRSSWGRAGLVIATATAVHPGYSGIITLELVNLGEVPLVLYPGLRIAQLVLSETTGADEYSGEFAASTDAAHGTLRGNKSSDVDFWLPNQ